LGKVLASDIPTPKSLVPGIQDAVSEAVMKALEREPADRFQTAREFAIALEKAGAIASSHMVGEWVRDNGGDELAKRANIVAQVESYPMDSLELLRGEEVSYAGDRTSAVAPPVDSDISRHPSSSPGARMMVTLTLIGVGAFAGLLVGQDVLFPKPSVEVTTSAAGGQGAIPTSLSSGAAFPPPVPTSSGSGAGSKGAPPPSTSSGKKETVDAGPPPAPKNTGRKTHPPPPPVRPRPPKKPNCETPFIVDKDGVKRVKPECVGQ
jgi:hypothetical protein